MSTFIPYPYFFAYIFLLFGCCVTQLNHDFVDSIVRYADVLVTPYQAFKTVCRYPVLGVHFTYDIYLPFLNWFLRPTHITSYFRKFSSIKIFIPNLVNALFSYACNFASLVL